MYELLNLAIEVYRSVGDPKAFRNAQDKFNNAYKRADYMAQGGYHEMWRRWLRKQPV